MTNAPVCATCGGPLRWYADHHGWGCDRCRNFIPTARPASTAAAPLPHAQAAYAGKRRRSMLPIALGVGGVAVVGIVIAIVVLTRGSSGGAASRDDVIYDTFTALENGDVDKLGTLGAGSVFERAMDCKKSKRSDDDDDDRPRRKKKDDDDFDDYRDLDKLREKMERDIRRQAAMMKGVKLEVVDIMTKEPPKLDEKALDDDDDDDRPVRKKSRLDDDDDDRDRDLNTHAIKKGKKVMPGCVARATFRVQEVKVRVRISEDDREPETQKVSISVLELDGRYYLSEPPKVKLHNMYGRMLDVVRDETCACTDSKCIDKLDKEKKRWGGMSSYALKEAKDALKKDELKKLEPIEKEIRECRKAAGAKAEPGEEMLAKMTEVTDKMCACKDRACADRVQEDFTKWSSDMAKNSMKDRDETPDEGTMKKFSDMMSKYTDCMTKLLSADFGNGGGGINTISAVPYGAPDQCSDYRDATAKLMSCSSVSESRKELYKERWESFARRWREADSTTRRSIEDECRPNADALRSMASGC